MGRMKVRIYLLLTLTILTLATVHAAGEPRATVGVKQNDWKTLSSYRDADLTAQLNSALRKQPGWQRLINRRRIAVALVDLNGDLPRFASVNGNVMMYAASLPKIAILLAAYQSFEDGSLEETPQIRQDLVDMIRTSSNKAATRVMDQVGMKKIESVLRDPRYGFYDENGGGGLWVGKRYAAEGPRRGDPLFNLSHGATANQVARFYYLLATGRLVNPERSRQMLQDLSEPALNHKFVAALRLRAPAARLYRKSGTWRDWHSDSILVRGQRWRNYILVALVQSSNGEKIVNAIVSIVEDIIEPDFATMS